ncbi:MAG: hypothetical protein K2I70_01245 [Bacilli bacterium]|nr:hypothetical protein [Bacilli bacterium]
MVYKLHKNGSFNIHTIKTDRFKNIRMEIMFRNNIDVSSVHKRPSFLICLWKQVRNIRQKENIL